VKRTLAGLGLSVWLAFGLHAAETGPVAAVRPADTAALDAIRGKIEALDLENALAAIAALLQQPELSDATRAGALDLRAQAHIAGGDLAAVEKDYREILALRPGYAPNPEFATKRALERFARIQAATVGTVHLDMDPADATLTLGGRPVERTTAGTFKATAGERTLHVERRGFDPMEVPVRVVAGQETLLKVSLVPNARHVVVRTDVPGVSIMLDGVPLGATAWPQGTSGSAPAELLIEDAAIGEHAITLQKSCYAPETRQEIVRVDLADRSPERLAVVTMRPARARVTVAGTPYVGELRVDGEAVAQLPVDVFTMCPGHRTVEAVASGRVVWAGIVEAGESDMTLDLTPRPSCSLVGSEWPKSWGTTTSAWSLRGRGDIPSGADLTTTAGWGSVVLPPGTDFALGVIPRGGVAGEDRIVLYSPALGMIEERTVPPASVPPVRGVRSIGAAFVDSAAGVTVATVAAAGPAFTAGIHPGDRVTVVDNVKVTRAADADTAVRRAEGGAPLALEIAAPGGTRRTVTLSPVQRPWVDSRTGPGESTIVRAGWAAADAAAGGADAAAAYAQLATLLDRAGRKGAASDAWRKVRALAGENPALAARADYAIGYAAASGGSATEAASLFTRAKSEAETAGDAGLAAAAADRLADLGIAGR
jgi:hypothetical protein